jgi:hypothetical protein
MKTLLCLALAASALMVADVALAHGPVSCPAAPRAERKPPAQLTKILKDGGWQIRKMQMYNNCYEVYGFDDKGRAVEAFFDPRTLARVAVPVAP